MKTIAIQGKLFSFHHLAAQKQFGGKNNWLHCQNFDQLLDAVATKKVNTGIIAVENSLVGNVADNYERIDTMNLKIIGEINLPIQLHLAAKRGTQISDLSIAYSHPVALAECSNFLSKNKMIVPTNFSDTAGAIRWVAEQQKMNQHLDAAAIGGIEAINHYGLQAIQKNIHDHHNNTTKFLAITL
ncbi:prephenate dehydratase domain-containing protein [Bernardetia sp.]|uniref:prephenate dehydratase domain-containing protein n=1 Tax=Bernardetia sp. TaxID=1937974 RepID=UPI0025BC252D|nr:prephenate dehydratase domain-containing protein [Bernardetia sp.]